MAPRMGPQGAALSDACRKALYDRGVLAYSCDTMNMDPDPSSFSRPSRGPVRLVALAAGLLIALGALSFLCAPLVAGASFRSAMAQAGFPEARFARASAGFSGARFETVALDPDGFSTIQSISVTYGIRDLIFRGRIRTLNVSGAVLTADWDPDTGPGLAGWAGRTDLKGSGPALSGPLPFESVSFENIRLDMATSEGGITLEGNANLTSTPDGETALSASVEGKQYQLSLKTALSGKRVPDGSWSLEASVENGRINLKSGRFSRIDGWVSASGGPSVQPVLSGQLTAGKFAAGWVQMQSLSATLDGTPQAPHAIVTGTAAGVPGLNLSAELRPESLIATLNAQKPTDLRDYLTLAAKALGRPPLSERSIPKGFSALTLSARRESVPSGQPAVRRYSVTLADAAKSLSARSDLMWDGATLAGTLETGPIALETLGALFPGFLPEGWRVASGSTQTQGQIAASWRTGGLRVDGPLKVRLTDVDLESDVATIKGGAGSLVFDSLVPPATTGVQTFTIKRADIGLPLENTSVRATVEPGGVVAVQSVSAGFAGGRVDAGAFRIQGGGFENADVRLSGVDLARAVKAFRSQGVTLSGVLDGRMTLSKKPAGSILAHGQIKTRAPGGVVRYRPDPVPAFLAGDDPGLVTARLALENLQYETLSVVFKGPLDGDMETQLSARGLNEEAFGARPVELNLNLQGAIFPLFRLAR